MTTAIDNLNLSEEFFCDEIREGFFVSETMKRYWAAQLKVLSEIDKICRKHNCNWYADCGTLLGATRHKGFVPWDDDLDITMFRDDLETFLAYAREELPEGYGILYVEDNEDYDLTSCRITNSVGINTHSEFADEYFGCPFAVGVDIFIRDKVYADEERETDRLSRASLVLSTIRGIQGKILSGNELSNNIKKIEDENNVSLGRENILTKLLHLFYEISKECDSEDYSEVVVMIEWVLNGRFKFPVSWYEEWEELPFETVTVRVPKGYNEILTYYYGEYHTIIRGTSAHDYPLYRKQEDVYRNMFGANPDRFFFDVKRFTPVEKRRSLMERQVEMLMLMKGIHGKVEEAISGEESEYTVLLQNLQNAAFNIGSVLEEKFGEGLEAVKILEEYCDAVYETAKGWNENTELILNKYLTDAEKCIYELYSGAKTKVLFLLCRYAWWESVAETFIEMASDTDNEVKVMPIPYYFHNNYKMSGKVKDDSALFSNLKELDGYLTDVEHYNFEKEHPDIIVTQFPYDKFSRSIGIPGKFYSDKLIHYTDRLVYVPFADPTPPVSKDDVAYKAMRELVEKPAVINSDSVIVSSEELRDCYVSILTDITGESFRKYWEEKIRLHLVL